MNNKIKVEIRISKSNSLKSNMFKVNKTITLKDDQHLDEFLRCVRDIKNTWHWFDNNPKYMNEYKKLAKKLSGEEINHHDKLFGDNINTLPSEGL